MKYLILLADGMAGWPIKDLGDKTTLEAANTPFMDLLASKGEIGLAKTVPENMEPGSDITNMGLMGYDPAKYYTGRAPLEALSMDIELLEEDVAFRCNLVNLLHHEGRVYMHDYSAGHITTEEGRELIEGLDKLLNLDNIKFFPGISYRHIMVCYNCPEHIANEKLFPPHDIMGKEVKDYLPENWENNLIVWLMTQAQTYLFQHSVNKKRIEEQKLPANSIWLWGQGKKPSFPLFKEKNNLDGAVIAAVDLIKGIGKAAGLDVVDVEGATGYLDTNYKGKADAALKALEDKNFVYLHVEASDETGHEGNAEKKIKAIENFDKKIIGYIYEKLILSGENFKILITADHPTPVEKRTHTNDPVPFIIYSSNNEKNNKIDNFSEKIAEKSKNILKSGVELFEKFINTEAK
jgi:2,3-bisphosphoglycerate-independent phosphoglycerate mutase